MIYQVTGDSSTKKRIKNQSEISVNYVNAVECKGLLAECGLFSICAFETSPLQLVLLTVSSTASSNCQTTMPRTHPEIATVYECSDSCSGRGESVFSFSVQILNWLSPRCESILSEICTFCGLLYFPKKGVRNRTQDLRRPGRSGLHHVCSNKWIHTLKLLDNAC